MLNKYVVTSIAVTCMMGLAACNNNDQGMEQRYTDLTQPIGYYSDENPEENRLDQGEGPVTEMLDGDDRNRTRSVPLDISDGRYDNPTNSYERAKYENQERFRSNAEIGRGDLNYHGHLNGRHQVPDMSNNQAYPGELTKNVADRAASIGGVRDCRAVVDGNRLLVAVDPADEEVNEEQLQRQVLKKVKPLAEKYDVRIVVDNGIFNSVRNIDNDIRDGGGNGLIRTNINSLYESIDQNVNRKDR
ncbi:spore cortex protein [Priestia megaterium]|nr:spore cortex protein [Priestia megaterium]